MELVALPSNGKMNSPTHLILISHMTPSEDSNAVQQQNYSIVDVENVLADQNAVILQEIAGDHVTSLPLLRVDYIG